MDVTSPESSISSLLASSGRLRSSLRPEPDRTVTYKDRQYVSASAALDAYIRDYQRSLRDRDTSTGTLQLPKPPSTSRDVLSTSLTDGELAFLKLPVRQSHSDGLSVTTDDLLVLPNDGSLPVTRTSALLSRSGSRSHPKHSVRRPIPVRSRNIPVDDLLTGTLSSHRQAPPPNVPSANQTPRSSFLPRWMTSQKSEMDFSGMTSVPDLKYPAWLSQCDESSGRPHPPRVPSWVGELESTGGQPYVKGQPIPEGKLFRDDRVDSLIWRAEQMLKSPSFGLSDVKAHNRSVETEDALDADRSWDNPPVTFKSPVPVGGAEEPEEHQRSQSAVSRSSGYSSRKHPGPVEALKHMLFRLQAFEHNISQSQTSSGNEISQSQISRVGNDRSQSQTSSGNEISQSQTTRVRNEICQSQMSKAQEISQSQTKRLRNEISQSQTGSGYKISQSQTSCEVKATSQPERETQEQPQDTEETDTGSGESLQRALHHLERLKTLVEHMKERRAGAEDDGTH